jgi:hypothetical protein
MYELIIEMKVIIYKIIVTDTVMEDVALASQNGWQDFSDSTSPIPSSLGTIFLISCKEFHHKHSVVIKNYPE